MNKQSYFAKKYTKPKPTMKPSGKVSVSILDPTYTQRIRDTAYIGNQGYTIPKSILTPEDLLFLQKSLELEPKQDYQAPGNSKSVSFPVYRENDQKIYIPRFYGIQRYGEPLNSKISEGDVISIPFVKPIRDYQEKIIQVYLDHLEKCPKKMGGAILEVPCGRGKCLARDTLVMMFDGTLRKVQDIQIGDLIMGDDSTPRTILSLARGREKMYEIREKDSSRIDTVGSFGTKYTVNESHILSLKNNHNRIYDICVKDYLQLYPIQKSALYGYRVPIRFQEKPVNFNAYDIGYDIGRVIPTPTGIKQIRIPPEYKYNCKKIQLQVLAGIIDAVGSYVYDHLDINPNISECFIIPVKTDTFLEDITFLVRSLGFCLYLLDSNSDKKKDGRKVVIYGYEIFQIPVKTEKTRVQVNVNIFSSLISISSPSMHYGIEIQEKEIDDYYGFEIDGNRRFVLGDFTVTHNTVMALKIASILSKKTLILVHKEFLMNQWIERISEFIPNARVGKIQGPVFDILEKDIVIGMIQSLYDRVFPLNAFSSFGLTIIDEVHRIGSEEFSKTLFKTISANMLGISATVERKDGLTELLYMFIGPKIYSEERQDENIVEVRAIEYHHSCEKYNTVAYDYKGSVQHSTMISKISNFDPRKEFAVRILRDLIAENPEKQIMVLSQIRALLTFLHDSLVSYGLEVGYYVGGMKKEALTQSETKRIVLATYAMAAEALDIKTLNTLVMVSPKTDIIQSVGRILRTRSDGKLIVDMVDTHDVFQNQWRKRRAYYKKCGYGIHFIASPKYTDMMNISSSTWKRIALPCVVSVPELDKEEPEEEIDTSEIKKKICYIPITSDMVDEDEDEVDSA